MKRILLFLSVLVFAFSSVWAQEEDQKKWSAAFMGTILSNAYSPSSVNHSSSLSGEMILGFSVDGGYSLSTYFGVSKNLTGTRETEVSDVFVGITKKLVEFSYGLSLKGTFRFYIPFSEYSRDTADLITSLYIAPTLTADLSKVGINYFKASYTPSFTKSFHQYKTTTDGTSNTEYKLSNSFSLSLLPNKKFNISLGFTYSKYWNYNGVTKSDQFLLSQSLGYLINDNMDITIGHSNIGDVLDPMGQNSNVQIFDESGSSYYLTFGLYF